MERKDHGVVELYSTCFLLALTVIFFTAISSVFLSTPQSSPGSIVNIEARMMDNNVILEHQGGDAISLNASISLFFNDTHVQIRAYDYVDTETGADGMWGFGEKVIYPIYRYYDDYFNLESIDIMIIDTDARSSIIYGITPVEPSTDLSLEIRVDQQYPMMGSPLVFTIILRNNGNINVTGITIRFELPRGLIFVSYITTGGIYDNFTSLWSNLDTIQPGQSAFLNVTTVVGQVICVESTQFLILLDGSGSIRKTDLDLIREGFVSVVGNSSIFPRNGDGELSVVQFGGNAGSVCAQVVLPPTVINNDTIASVLATLNATTTMPGLAATACGFLLGSDTVTASSFFTVSKRQVVLLITDGKASLICNIDGDYFPDPPSGVDALTSAIQARDYLIDAFGRDHMRDEIDVIAVHVTKADTYRWFKDDLVWPQPGYYAPPFRNEVPLQGFVSNASDWDEFPAVFKNVLASTFNRIEVSGSIVQISMADPKIVNNIDSVVIIPQII